MTAQEFDFLAGELAEAELLQDDKRKAEVRARTAERLKAINAEYAGMDELNPRIVGDDFWPEWETE